LIFYDGQTSFSRRGVEIIHRNFIEPAAEVGVRVRDAKVGAVSPGEVFVDWLLSAAQLLVSEGLFLRL